MVGIALLLLEHGVIAPDAPPRAQVEPKKDSARPETKPNEAPKRGKDSSLGDTEVCRNPHIVIDNRAVEGAMRDAGGVSSANLRDDAYQKVIGAAIDLYDYELAIKAARLISSSNIRDDQLMRIVYASVKFRKYDCASVAANSISSSNYRDAAHSYILDSRLSLGGE